MFIGSKYRYIFCVQDVGTALLALLRSVPSTGANSELIWKKMVIWAGREGYNPLFCCIPKTVCYWEAFHMLSTQGVFAWVRTGESL